MKKGIIIFFDPYKGFGKISTPEGIEYFVGINDLRDQVKKDDPVEFMAQKINDKWIATKVSLEKK